MVLERLNTVVTHELLHMLGIAQYFRKPLTEGITEWYSQQIIRSAQKEEPVKESVNVAYPDNVETVDILITGLLAQGLTIEDIDNAFIANDLNAIEKFKTAVVNRYGEKDADMIFNWDFPGQGNSRDALNKILRMEKDIAKKNKPLYSYNRNS